MKVSDDELGQLTMRQFDLLVKRSNELRCLDDFRSGVIAAAIANTTRSKSSDRIWSAVDFFPALKAFEKRSEPKSVWGKIVAAFGMFGMKTEEL